MFSLFARTVQTVRCFSTSAAPQFPKLKSHNGTKKRWRSIASGKFKRAQAGHKHLNVNKESSRKNNLGHTVYSHGPQTAKLKKLLPYGSP